MKTLKKGQIVTVVSERDFIITIQETTVLSSGTKETMLDGFYMKFNTEGLMPNIKDLESKSISYTYIAPNEEFIKEYIRVAKEIRLKGLKKAEKNLEMNPNSRRYKSHLKLYKNEVQVLDKRKEVA